MVALTQPHDGEEQKCEAQTDNDQIGDHLATFVLSVLPPN
jgi:hypothetical protein